MPGREVADVEADVVEADDLHRLTSREEPIGDATLIEHLDRARVEAARPRAIELLVGAALDDGDVDTRQRKLGGERQPRRTTTDDDHGVLVVRQTPTSHRPTHVRRASVPHGWGLAASPPVGRTLSMEGTGDSVAGEATAMCAS